MSNNSNFGFTDWFFDDLVFFVLSMGSLLIIGVPLLLVFLLISIGVLIILLLPFLFFETIFRGNLLIDILGVLILIIWFPGFLVSCALYYRELLELYPTSLPNNLTTMVWWAGLPVIVVGYIGHRTTGVDQLSGTYDLILFFGPVFFSSYLIATRGRVLINTVRSTSGKTVTTVVSGYLLAGGTVEVVTYLVGRPIGGIFASNGESLVGMFWVYLPVAVLILLLAEIFELTGIPFGDGFAETGNGSMIEQVLLFDTETGEGIVTALAAGFLFIPAIVLFIEITWYGRRDALMTGYVILNKAINQTTSTAKLTIQLFKRVIHKLKAGFEYYVLLRP